MNKMIIFPCFLLLLVYILQSSEVIKHFSCSFRLSMHFQPLINRTMGKQIFSCLKSLDFFSLKKSQMLYVFLLIHTKMPTIVGILTLISRIKSMLSLVRHENSFITSEPG